MIIGTEVPSEHTVTVVCGVGGRVVCGSERFSGTRSFTVARFGSISITAVPNLGYAVDAITSDSTSGLTLGKNTATLNDLSYNATLSVSFRYVGVVTPTPTPAPTPTPTPTPTTSPSPTPTTSQSPAPSTSPSPSPTPGSDKYVRVDAASEKGGSISPSGQIALPIGGSQTFTVTPDEGYELEAVYLNGELVPLDGNSFTLTDISEDADIRVVYRPVGSGECRCLWAGLFGSCAVCGQYGHCVGPWCWLIPLLLIAVAGATVWYILRRRKNK